MALSRVKTWIAGEVLTASDLNTEFNNIIDNLSVALSGTFADGTVSLPGLAFTNDTDSGLYRAGANQIGWTVGGIEVLRASPYASGVNYLLVAPGQAGQGAVLVATGSDTNVPLFVIPKGTGYVRVPVGTQGSTRFYPGLGLGGSDEGLLSLTTGTIDLVAGGRRVIQASAYAEGTNYLRVTPSQSGQPVIVDTAGGDTNSALLLRGQGTGYVQASNYVFENFAATQSPTITGRAYWQSTEGSLHISTGTLMARVPAVTGLQSGDLLIGSGTVSGATIFARVQRPPVEYCRLVHETSTKLNLASGFLPLKVGGVWVRRDVHTPVELLAPSVTSNTLYYVYAYDAAGVTTLEASTTTHVGATQHGVRVKSGDETRTLVGMVFAENAGAFLMSQATQYVTSWFNRSSRLARTFFSTNRTTTSGTFVEIDPEIRANVIMWASEYLTVGLAATVNNEAVAAVTTALGIDSANAEPSFGMHSSAAASITVGCGGSYSKAGLSEGTHYVTLLGLTTGGSTGTWLSDGSSGRYTTLTALVTP